jgi:hypothetical protein
VALRLILLVFSAVVQSGRWRIILPGDGINPQEVEKLTRVIRDAEKAALHYLGFKKNDDCVMKVAPSSGDFSAWTGCSIWQAAALTNGELVTQPIQVLEKRGVLCETITHEYVHMTLEPYSVPLWLNEGLAVLCSGQIKSLGTERNLTKDPAEIERLLKSRDTLELRQGYLASALLTQETIKELSRDSLASILKEEAR